MVAIERHPAMLPYNQMAGCVPCHNGTLNNLHTRSRRKEWGAPPPDQRREPTAEPTLPLPKMPPAPTGTNSGSQHSQIVNLLAGYACSHTSLPNAELFTIDASTQDSRHDTDFDPDMPTDEGISTGLYTICCVVMPLTSMLKTTAAYRANLRVMTSSNRKAWDCGDYCYLQSADTVMYIFKDIFVCIIKEQCSDQEESKRKQYKDCQNNVNDRLHQIKWLHIVDTPKAKWASTECQQF